MWRLGYIAVLFNLFIVVSLTNGEPSPRYKRETAELSPGNWDSCKPGAEAPPTRVPTYDQVNLLRQYFATLGIEGYLIPNEDAHQSEYPSEYDKRRGFISGFKGSAGFAVVTTSKAALWTDGRYFLEAEDVLDCIWILMRQKESGVPTMLEWLKNELSPGQYFGASPYLIGSSTWKYYKEELAKSGIALVAIENELVDLFWSSGLGRPDQPNTPINALPLEFAGVSWQDKVKEVKSTMEDEGVNMMVVTGLDETAWLFNLRASDISYNPFFLSYAIVTNDKIILYILNHQAKLIQDPTDEATTVKLHDHLNTNIDGTCTGKTGDCVEVKEYNPINIRNDIRTLTTSSSKVWLSTTCNQAMYSAVNVSKIFQRNTPIAVAKSKKNAVEVEGMKRSHIRDAVALITFLTKLEKEVKEGKKWTELSAAQDLDQHRREQEHNRGLSFNTISGSGRNGAIIHYTVSNITSIDITTKDMYLVDSGGQYLDGTTDVTRTFHFGSPTDYEKECYTRVLMGHIDLFQAKWPKGSYGHILDTLARKPLWDVGLVYRHGTGHGIGMYLSVHEGPGRISSSQSTSVYDNPLDENQFFSDEPGFYEDGKFGIRLENIIRVVNATTDYSFPGTQFLTFEHVTLVPYEPHLIVLDLLNDKQIQYLNDYNEMVREKVGPELKKQDKTAAYDWMIKRTEPFKRTNTTSSAARIHLSLIMFCVNVLFLLCV
ncbi:Xaa-Pro aminopeptidase 1 [Mactra antiquata]